MTAPTIATNVSSRSSLNRRLFVALFCSTLIVWTVGNGLFPLLPVYALRLGAESSSIGYYLSATFAAVAIGTILAGWLSDRFQRRKTILLAASIASVPTPLLIGQFNSFSGLIVFTMILFFIGGMGLTLTTILAGLHTSEQERGKIFGALALTNGLGSIIGGSAFGLIADRFGFYGLFLVTGLILLTWPLAVVLVRDKTSPAHIANEKRTTSRVSLGPRTGLPLFLTASIIGNIVLYEGRLGTSFRMDGLGFSSTAIASTTAVGGAVGLALSPLLGSLSDRYHNRKQLLVLCGLPAVGGMALLSMAFGFWEFSTAAALLSVFSITGGGLGSAFVTDLVDHPLLGRGLSLYTATFWTGAIVGLAATGFLIQNLGATAFIIGAITMLGATALLLIVSNPNKAALN